MANVTKSEVEAMITDYFKRYQENTFEPRIAKLEEALKSSEEKIKKEAMETFILEESKRNTQMTDLENKAMQKFDEQVELVKSAYTALRNEIKEDLDKLGREAKEAISGEKTRVDQSIESHNELSLSWPTSRSPKRRTTSRPWRAW